MMQWPCHNPDLNFFSRRRILMKIQHVLPLALRHLRHSGKAAMKVVRFEPSSLWPSLGYFPVAVCGMSLQFSIAHYKSCCLKRFLLALVRHISARAGHHHSGHCGKAGSGDCDQPRKPSDFTNRRKQSSPTPLTGLYLHHPSSSLPRRRSPGLCCFLNHICYVAEDKMVKQGKLPTARHRQLQGSAWGCLCPGTAQLTEHRYSTRCC